MEARSAATSIDDYIAEFPDATRKVLEEMRTIIRSAAPEATETISYAIPTFDLAGRHLVHFAGFPRHVGLYPTPSGMEAFDAELTNYKRGKGSVRFPLDAPLPADLVERIVRFRVSELAGTDPGRVAVENVNHPGRTTVVDARKYTAMRAALLRVLPPEPPGLTQAEMLQAVLPELPEDEFPGGGKAGWWAKTTQLDLEAKGLLVRERTSPLRWHRASDRG